MAIRESKLTIERLTEDRRVFGMTQSQLAEQRPLSTF
jgi:hypothetical protein